MGIEHAILIGLGQAIGGFAVGYMLRAWQMKRAE